MTDFLEATKHVSALFFQLFSDLYCRMSGASILVWAEDGSLPGPEKDHEQVYKYRQQFELHEYYESIKDVTFTTTFLPLSVEEV